MPTPVLPKPIKIIVTSGIKGTPITIRNRTNGDIIKDTLDVTGRHVVDLQNFTNGYTDGDIIDIIFAGSVVGSSTLTTSGTVPQSVTVSTSTANAAARGI